MLLNESEHRLDGAVITRKQIHCSRCGMNVDFDGIHYIDSQSRASRLIPLLFNRTYFTLSCPQCGNSFDVGWWPVILDISDIGLLIFATPWIDDGAVSQGFGQYAKNVFSYLDDERQVRIYRSPYTIVYGAQGLGAILQALGTSLTQSHFDPLGKPRNWRALFFWHDADDVPAIWNVQPESLSKSCDLEVTVNRDQSIPIRILHGTDGEFSLEMSDGYIYGNLFFFYPSQRFIQSVVHAFLKVSTAATDEESQRLTYTLFGHGPVAETSHPWILRELGRLALTVDPSAASSLLKRSLDAQHTWLAVTASFMDATPRRREENEELTEELSAAETRKLGRRVDNQRHTLLRQFPAEEDYGRWYFPYSEQCSISAEYTLEELGAIFGHSFRNFESLVRNQTRISTGTLQYWWSTAANQAIVAIESYDGFGRAFWQQYLPAWSSLPRESAKAQLLAAVADRCQHAPSDDPLVALWTAAIKQL